MHIAFICGNYWCDRPNGSMVSTHNLASSLCSNNIVEVICGQCRGKELINGYKITELHGFPYLSFHPSENDFEERCRAASNLIAYFEKCSKRIMKTPFDIVDAQGPWCSCPTIVTVRFVLPAYLESLKRAGLLFTANDPWINAILECERKTYTAKTIKRYIAVSSKTKYELMYHYKVNQENVTVVNNGVDLKRFAATVRQLFRKNIRKKLQVSEDHVLIAFCGNNLIRKNIKTFLETVRDFYSFGVRIALLVEVETARQFLKASDWDNVVYCRVTANPEKILSACDILLFPTIYDTCAKIVLEAMGIGLSVVTCTSSGLSGIIRNGENGFILDSNQNVAAFQEVLFELIRNRSLRERIGEMASMHIHCNLSWNQVSEKTINVYKEIC